MTKPVTTLKGVHKGHDVYVIASGASAGFINPAFFENKWSIGVNEVWKRFDPDYLLRKESQRADEAWEYCQSSGAKMIVSEWSCGSQSCGKNDLTKCDYWFEHGENKMQKLDLSIIGTDKIIVSFSTITSAIHLAAYMGASNIILVGHDCGTLDGKQNFPEYPEPIHEKGRKFYKSFLGMIEPQTKAIRERIRQVYGCNIYSLNPFLNFGLEGHEYER